MNKKKNVRKSQQVEQNVIMVDESGKEEFDKLVDIVGKLQGLGQTEILQEVKEDIQFEVKQEQLKKERESRKKQEWLYRIVEKESGVVQG